MSLPDASAFSLALLIGGITAANVALLNFVQVRPAVVMLAFPELGIGAVPGLRRIAHVNLRTWALGTSSLLVFALLLHMTNIFIDGLSTGVRPEPIGFEIRTAPLSGQQDAAADESIVYLLEPRVDDDSLDSPTARTITAAVMSLLMVATGGTLLTVVRAMRLRPVETEGGPDPIDYPPAPFRPVQ